MDWPSSDDETDVAPPPTRIEEDLTLIGADEKDQQEEDPELG